VRHIPILGRSKVPLPTNPNTAKTLFGWSWRRGLFPPPMIVILTSALCEEESPIQSKGGTDPFRTYPKKTLNLLGGVLRG